MVYLLGLLVVVAYLMITHDPATRHCRWRKDRSRDTPARRYWTCDYCGAEAWTEGGPPETCARPPDLRP